jgi:hypothetical protein
VRPPVKKDRIPRFERDSPCPCDSGKRVSECCAIFGGGVSKRRRISCRSAPVTGLQHPRCYLRETRDCSTQNSKEHFTSRDVLEVLGDKMGAVDGTPPDEQREIGINSLSAHVLCSRHNSALSRLDQAAGTFFARWLQIHSNMKAALSLEERNSLALPVAKHWNDGCSKPRPGISFQRTLAAAREPCSSTIMGSICISCNAPYLPATGKLGCGLYTRGRGTTFKTAGAVKMCIPVKGRLSGGQIIIAGLSFDLVFDNRGFEEEWVSAGSRASASRIDLQKRAATSPDMVELADDRGRAISDPEL